MIDVKNTRLLTADTKLADFTKKQEKLWDMFFKDGSAHNPLKKSELVGKKLDDFRPNMWSGRFIYDDDGEICDLEMNQIGEELAKYYGQRKGQHMMNDYNDNSFRTDFPTYHYRFKQLIDEMLDKKLPLLTISHYMDQENNQKDINVIGLLLPVTSDGSKIDMILGYSELSIS